jgi:hypothetical protein
MKEELTFINGDKYLGLDHYNNLNVYEQKEEYLMSKMNALYWAEHFACAPVTGGHIHMGTSEQWKSTPKFRILFHLFQHHDSITLLSSRQIGKTTLGLMYAVWAMTFFPGIQVMFLTLNTVLAKDAVDRIRKIIEALPNFMQIKDKSNAAKTTFIDFTNGSKFMTSFISGAVDPDKAGRGLSQPIVILDEFAFCNHSEIVYTAMQPSIATAKIHAKKNGYPTLLLGVSTPNGAGNNTFYLMRKYSIKLEDIYDFDKKVLKENAQDEFDKSDNNNFIGVSIHWSETHRDEEWYQEQCKILLFNQRRINQELDLAFLGSSTSIFSDDIILELKPKKWIKEFSLEHGYSFKLFSDLDPTRVYLLGADTSASTGPSSDYSALSLIDAITGQEVGVWKGQFSVVKQYSSLLKKCIRELTSMYKLDEKNLIVIIERNSFGKGVVEELVYSDLSQDLFEYEPYVWMDTIGKNNDAIYGFYTSNAGKMGAGRRDQMFSELLNHINSFPELIHSNELISELRDLEEKATGRIEACRGSHDDVVMAYNFCLYVRQLMIKDGDIVLENDTVVFALDQDMINDYIDVSLASNHDAIVRGEVEEIKSSVIYDRNYKYNIDDDLSSYLDNKRLLRKEDDINISDFLTIM